MNHRRRKNGDRRRKHELGRGIEMFRSQSEREIGIRNDTTVCDVPLHIFQSWPDVIEGRVRGGNSIQEKM